MSDEKKIGLGIGVIILALLLFLSISTVDTGNTGFRVTFGKVSKEVLEEGVHFKIEIGQTFKMAKPRNPIGFRRWAVHIRQTYN